MTAIVVTHLQNQTMISPLTLRCQTSSRYANQGLFTELRFSPLTEDPSSSDLDYPVNFGLRH